MTNFTPLVESYKLKYPHQVAVNPYTPASPMNDSKGMFRPEDVKVTLGFDNASWPGKTYGERIFAFEEKDQLDRFISYYGLEAHKKNEVP